MKLTNTYWKRYAGILLLLLLAGTLTFAVTVFASDSSPNMVGTMSCAVEEGEGEVTVNVMVDTGGDEIDSVRMESFYDPAVLSNPRISEGDDFDTPAPGGGVELEDGRVLFVQTYGRSGTLGAGSGELSFAKIIFDWSGDSTTFNFNPTDSGIGQGSFQLLIGGRTPLNVQGCAIGGEDTLPTIGEIVVTGGYTTLFAALDAANLADTFANPSAGPFTVFAPLESAFEGLPAGTLDALLANPGGLLTDILNYHVVSGTLLSDDIILLDSFTTLSGEEVAVSVSEGAVTLNDAALIVTTNIEASNGIIHVIDTVLQPPVEVTATPEPTATDVPPPATDVPPTATDVPPTATDVPPTATDVPPTATDVPPTATNTPSPSPIPPTATPETVTVVATEVIVSGTIVITGTVFISVTVTPMPTDVPPAVTAVPTAIPEPTLLDVIFDSPDHTVLEQLIIDLQMETLLNGLNAGDYTLFAPNDDTIQLYLSEAFGLMSRLESKAEKIILGRGDVVNAESLEIEVNKLLRDVILNHVLVGTYSSAELFELTATMSVTLSALNGNDIILSTVEGELRVNDLLVPGQFVTVTEADLTASNGVIHVVDQEDILPSSVGLGGAMVNENGRLLPLFTAVALIALTSTAIGIATRRQ